MSTSPDRDDRSWRSRLPARRTTDRKVVPRRPSYQNRPREDLEFLPAALEILETPPSPISGLFVWSISLILAIALAWSVLTRIDIYSIATGRIQLSGRSKTVQPLEPGRVRSVSVQNGQNVKAGELLVELDSTETQADVDAGAREFESLDAEISRRQAVIAAGLTNQDERPAVSFSAGVGPGVRDREQQAMLADWMQFSAMRESLKAQLEQSRAQKRRLNMSVDARSNLIGSLQERVDMRQKLIERDAGTKASAIDALQQLQSEQTNLAYDRGQIIETDAAITLAQRKIEQQRAEFISTQMDKLHDADNKRDHARQDLVKAQAKEDRTRLLAPTSGTVQQLAITTVGQVVTSGEPLMVIVPNTGPLEVEALMANRDVGFIELGQKAVVKIDAFPFTRYGKIDGTVTRVSHDAVDNRDVNGSTDTSRIARGQSITQAGGASNSQDLVFPVTINLARASLFVDGRDIPLTPGMTVAVEIRTGDRPVIDYVLSPLREMVSTTAHER